MDIYKVVSQLTEVSGARSAWWPYNCIDQEEAEEFLLTLWQVE